MSSTAANDSLDDGIPGAPGVETVFARIEEAAASISAWLSASDGSASDVVARSRATCRSAARYFLDPVVSFAGPERLTFGELESGTHDDGSPVTLFFHLRAETTDTYPTSAGLAVFGSHTALVTTRDGTDGCRLARLVPGSAEFRMVVDPLVLPPESREEHRLDDSLGMSVYRLLLRGGVLRLREETRTGAVAPPPPGRGAALLSACILVEAAGGRVALPWALGSDEALRVHDTIPGAETNGANAPSGDDDAALGEPLFGVRGLFRP